MRGEVRKKKMAGNEVRKKKMEGNIKYQGINDTAVPLKRWEATEPPTNIVCVSSSSPMHYSAYCNRSPLPRHLKSDYYSDPSS